MPGRRSLFGNPGNQSGSAKTVIALPLSSGSSIPPHCAIVRGPMIGDVMPGTYELRFGGGRVVKTIEVRAGYISYLTVEDR